MTPLPAPPRRALQGYAPLVALLVAFAAITAFVPTTGQETTETIRGPVESGHAPSTITEGAPSGDGNTGRGGAGDDGATPTTAPTTNDGGQPDSAGDNPDNAESSACPDRVSQVPGDPYSPPCRTFTGDNGGATAAGVTGDAIQVTFRYTDDTALNNAVSSSVGDRVEINDSPSDIRRTVEGLADYFNENFQFYGRQIEIRWFDGRGSVQTELLGGGQSEAAADAVTASEEIGAFADVSRGTAPYADALARRQIVHVGLGYLSDEWYQGRHPFVWGEVSCTDMAHLLAEYANKRLFGSPAAWAGAPFQGRQRRVAVIAPENSYYQHCVRTLIDDIEAAGNQVAANLSYALDISTASQDTSAIVARLAEEEVTTVLTFTDQVSPVFYTAKAEQQNYRPEWIVGGTSGLDDDTNAQLYEQAQWQRAFGLRILGEPSAVEARIPYQAFKSVRPDEEPATFFVDTIYRNLYVLAAGVQQAGPNLTPDTFATGLQSFAGGTGERGTWRGATGSHTLLRDAREVWWNPDAVSPANGAPGAYIATTPRFGIGEWPADAPRVFE